MLVHLADEPQATDDLEQLEARVREGPVHVALDFSAVHYLASSNIARLLRIRRHVADARRKLLLCCMSDPVWGTFMVTGIDKMFTRTDSVPLSLAMLSMGSE